MKIRFLVLAAILLILPAVSFSAEKKKAPAKKDAKAPATVKTQTKKDAGKDEKRVLLAEKDFAVMLVEQFGWTDGLPKDPKERDYLVILDGKRTFRYEAESSYNPATDGVVLRRYNIYGPFTGKGWLGGVSTPVSATFTLFLPIEGEYDLLATVGSDRSGDYAFSVNGKNYSIKADSGLKERFVGKMRLKAGQNVIKILFPPMGAVDNITLAASDLKAIQPFKGWRFKDTLKKGQMAEIGVVLMNAFDRFPPSGMPVRTISVADVAEPAASAEKTTVDYLGEFKSREWLRADYRGAVIKIPVNADEAGYYDVTSRIMGKSISGEINGVRLAVTANDFLSRISLGLHRLEAGKNLINLKIPPGGGIDTIELSKRKSDSADFMAIAGFSGDPASPVTREEALSFIAGIKSKYKVRTQ